MNVRMGELLNTIWNSAKIFRIIIVLLRSQNSP